MDGDSSGLAAVSSLDDPVRARLYDVVSASSAAVGRDEAAAAAGIGRPLAAYHLDKLVELGLFTATYQRPGDRTGPGAGRPAKLYARSGREFAVTVPPREYEVAARLLAVAVQSDTSGQSSAALRDAARRYGAWRRPAIRPQRPPGLRVKGCRRHCASTASSRGEARMARSGCATARSISWPPSTATWSAA